MLQFDPAWAYAALLLWLRLASLLVLSPLAAAIKAPIVFWLLFTLALAGTLSAALGLRTLPPAGALGLVLSVLGEVGLGALLGFALHCAFAAWLMAGRLLDVQMGFGMATILDPISGSQAPVMGTALSLLGMAVFFGVEGHQMLLRGIAYSVQAVPPGGAWQLANPQELLQPVLGLFSAGLVVMGPVIFVLVMLEIVLAVTSRVLPQMNVMFVGMPVKILVGFSVLALAAPAMGPAMARSYQAMFSFWQGVLR